MLEANQTVTTKDAPDDVFGGDSVFYPRVSWRQVLR